MPLNDRALRPWLVPGTAVVVAGLIAACGIGGIDLSAYLMAAYLCPLLLSAFRVLRRAEGENVLNQRRGAYGLLAAAIAVMLPCVPLFLRPDVRTVTLLVAAGCALLTSLIAIVARFGRVIDRLLVWQTLLENVQVSVVLVALLWEWVFVHVAPPGVPQPLILAVVIVIGVLAAFLFQGGAREPEPGIRRLVLSALPILLCALLDLYTTLSGAPRWTADLFTTLAFAVLVDQIHKSARSPAPPTSPGEAETRRVSAVVGLIALLTILAVASLSVDREIEPVTWLCIVLYILSVAARDVLQTVRSRRLTQELRWQALHDPLTGLANRRALDGWIEEQNRLPEMSIITVDLDHFKDVNDLLGHSTGDRLLVEVAGAMRDCLSDCSAEAFRMGGDEFTVVTFGPPAKTEATATALMHAIAEVVTALPGVKRLGVSASVGLQHLPAPRTRDGLRASLDQAGHAMRLAKRNGRHRVEVFNDSLHVEQQRTKLIEVRLRERVRDVDLHFQPIWDVRAEQVIGWEALARWNDDICGEVPPTEFIPIAEQVGLIDDLGMAILESAIATAAHHQAVRSDQLIHVNVSALQLRMPDFPDRVLRTLAASALPATRLMLELTESVGVRAGGVEPAAMQRLTEAGVRLALDHFGASSTSMAHLTKLPVSMVKIDESLTRDLQCRPAPRGSCAAWSRCVASCTCHSC